MVVDNTSNACAGETELVMGTLEGFELLDVDHDGQKDVQIKVRAAKIRVPRQPPLAMIRDRLSTEPGLIQELVDLGRSKPPVG